MDNLRKFIGVGAGVAYLFNTAQGFANSKEVPVKAMVPNIAYTVLTVTAGTSAIHQLQIPVDQALPVKMVNPYALREVTLNSQYTKNI